MFKLISAVVAGAIVLAPLLPAQADSYRVRSRGFGVTVGTPGFGISIGSPYGRRYRPFRNEVFLRRSGFDPYIYRDRYYPNTIYSPGFGTPVIVAPRARTVIINRGNDRYRSAYCGSVIYGNPIASPIPVDPFSGLACR